MAVASLESAATPWLGGRALCACILISFTDALYFPRASLNPQKSSADLQTKISKENTGAKKDANAGTQNGAIRIWMEKSVFECEGEKEKKPRSTRSRAGCTAPPHGRPSFFKMAAPQLPLAACLLRDRSTGRTKLAWMPARKYPRGSAAALHPARGIRDPI